MRNFSIVLFLLAIFACSPPSTAPIHKFGASATSTGLSSTGTTQANGLVVRTSPGYIVAIYVYNTTASNVWAVMANQTTIPSGFTTMMGSPVLIPANAAVVLGTDFFGTGGILFSTGIVIGITTSETSYTAGGASFDIVVNYI